MSTALLLRSLRFSMLASCAWSQRAEETRSFVVPSCPRPGFLRGRLPRSAAGGRKSRWVPVVAIRKTQWQCGCPLCCATVAAVPEGLAVVSLCRPLRYLTGAHCTPPHAAMFSHGCRSCLAAAIFSLPAGLLACLPACLLACGGWVVCAAGLHCVRTAMRRAQDDQAAWRHRRGLRPSRRVRFARRVRRPCPPDRP